MTLITSTQEIMHLNKLRNLNKVLKIAHLNAELLKCRQHFTETKETREMTLRENFGTPTISETWFNSKIFNTSVEIEGYKVYGLD